MRGVCALVSVLALVGCSGGPAKQHNGRETSWQNGEAVSADGTRFQILCLNGEWLITVKTVERLVPPEAERQWVNRDVIFQFDNERAQRTKGTLNENRLDLVQSEEGSTVSLNYGQDVAAGLMRGNHKTLLVRTTDGASRPKEWRFDIDGSHGQIPNDPGFNCPVVGG
jgi:hypothetical protein